MWEAALKWARRAEERGTGRDRGRGRQRGKERGSERSYSNSTERDKERQKLTQRNTKTHRQDKKGQETQPHSPQRGRLWGHTLHSTEAWLISCTLQSGGPRPLKTSPRPKPRAAAEPGWGLGPCEKPPAPSPSLPSDAKGRTLRPTSLCPLGASVSSAAK